jgi:hypothetical protein
MLRITGGHSTVPKIKPAVVLLSDLILDCPVSCLANEAPDFKADVFQGEIQATHDF